MEEWCERWEMLWRVTANCAVMLSEVLMDRDSLDAMHNPVRHELLAMCTRLEGLLGTDPTAVLLTCQADCCIFLALDAQQHLDARQARRRMEQGQPYFPQEGLESLAAGASRIVTVLVLAATPGEPRGSQNSGFEPCETLVVAVRQLLSACSELIAGYGEEQACRVGPAPLVAAKATEACLRLAAALPGFLADEETEALVELAGLPMHAPLILMLAPKLLAGGTATTILLEHRLPSAALSAAAYNGAVSAAKVHRPLLL